jgi:outer membrane protein assembly factor BamB
MKRAGLHIALLLILAACRKDKVLVQQPPTDTNKPALVWRVPFDAFETTMSIDPHVLNGNVVFGCHRCPDAGIKLHNGQNGEVIWEWANWQQKPSEFITTEFSFLSDGHLVVSAGREWVSIDFNQQKQNWSMVKTNQTLNPMRTYNDDGFAFTTARFNFNNNGATSQACILRSSLTTFQLDTVFSYTTPDHYRPWFEGMAFTQLTNGDRIIIIKNRAYSTVLGWPNAGRLDVIAYNMTADSLMWFEQGVEANEGGVLSIRTLGNLAFVPGYLYIHCLDVETGQKIWDYKVEKALYLGDLIVHNNTLLYKGANDDLVCLNPYTGQEIWKVKGTGVGPKARLTVYNDKVFYTADGYLRVASAIDGRELYTSKGEDWDRNGPLTCTPAIDPVNRRIFINNSTYATCLQMPEDW